MKRTEDRLLSAGCSWLDLGITATSPSRFDVTRLNPVLSLTHERLAGVWIECTPWEEFLDGWDRPSALFYFDPPYQRSEHFYGRGFFKHADYTRLAERLRELRGRHLDHQRYPGTASDLRRIQGLFCWRAPFDREDCQTCARAYRPIPATKYSVLIDLLSSERPAI